MATFFKILFGNIIYIYFFEIFLPFNVLFCFIKDPVKSNNKAFKDCNLFWGLNGFILEPGAWADLM